jgi:hypothetical protein
MRCIRCFFTAIITITLYSLPNNIVAQQWQSFRGAEYIQVTSDGNWITAEDGCLMTPCYSLYSHSNYNSTVSFIPQGPPSSYNSYPPNHFINDSTGIWFRDTGLLVTQDLGINWTLNGRFKDNHYSPSYLKSLFMINDSLSYLSLNYYLTLNPTYTTQPRFAKVTRDSTLIMHNWDSLKYHNLFFGENINFINDSTGFITLTDTFDITSYILKTENYGSNWHIVLTDSLNPFRSMNFQNPQNGIVVSTNQIYETRDAGLTWSSIPSPSFSIGNFISAGFYNDSVGYLTSDSGYVLRTNNRGIAWNIEIDSSSNYRYHRLFLEKIIDADIAYISRSWYTLFRRSKLIPTALWAKQSNQGELIIYPNPSNSQIQLKLPKAETFVKFLIYDITGSLVATTTSMPIDVSEFNNGTYFIQTNTEQKVYHSKFVKVD